MTNKVETYVANIQDVIENITNENHINQLSEVQAFLLNLSDLFGRDIQQPVQAQERVEPQNRILVGGIIPAAPSSQDVIGQVFAPPAPSAPGALKLSSGTVPQVEGCIAAQPNTIMQQAAQQRLNALLIEQEAERKAQQAEAQAKLDAALTEKKSQDELTASFLQQMMPKTAEVVPAPVVQAVDPTKGMTLADFVAMQKKIEESLSTTTQDVIADTKELLAEQGFEVPSVPVAQMSLEDFVKAEVAKQSNVSESQAQLDALLTEQLANKQESIHPGTSSPLA
jgi:hypothetical protein